MQSSALVQRRWGLGRARSLPEPWCYIKEARRRYPQEIHEAAEQYYITEVANKKDESELSVKVPVKEPQWRHPGST